jgi:metallo-beta-lactamase family protein
MFGAMQLQFLGAADGVTGSRHLIDLGGTRLLLDCGLFQGLKTHRERNWAPLPVPASSIDAVVLSHAHLDHSGWLPVLVREGFQGPVIASPATADVAAVLLLDSAHLAEEDARRANRGGWSKHTPARPLYTAAEARRALSRFKTLQPGRSLRVGSAIVELQPAGHLLGACSVSVRTGGTRLVFSGDLGRDDDLVMPPPQPVTEADVLIVESTYGDRRHPPEDAAATLGSVIRDTIGRGGSVLMPSFAVGRAQALLLLLQRLRAAGEIPVNLPIHLDSPMAQTATALYQRHRRLLRLAPREVASLTDGVTLGATPQQSRALATRRYPAVIISASGMATGGRVLHHLATMAPDPRHHVVFPGFQAAGTRGAHLVAGATEVKIFGRYVPVRAQVSHLSGLSAHADADGLMAWMRHFRRPPAQTFVVHGEPAAADTLRLRVQDELGWRVRVPEHGSVHDVGA